MLAILSTLPEHVCGRGCDICAEAIGAAALGTTPFYVATLTALAAASDRKRTARTVGDFLAADEEVKRLRATAAGMTPITQLVDEVPSC